MKYILKREMLVCYEKVLIEEEKSQATIEKYMRDVRKFFQYVEEMGKKEGITKEIVLSYKRSLIEEYAPSSVNSMLADSGCQIPVGSKEDQGIFIVPLTITMDEKSYLDDLEIHSEDVFKRMEKDGIMVMTSQPSTGSLQEAVQKIKEQGYSHIIGLPIATGLSSTMNF